MGRYTCEPALPILTTAGDASKLCVHDRSLAIPAIRLRTPNAEFIERISADAINERTIGNSGSFSCSSSDALGPTRSTS